MNVIDCFVLTFSGTTAVSLSSATPPLDSQGYMSGKTVYRMIISVDGGDIGWRADGTIPKAGSCHVLADGGSLSLTGANYKSVIRQIQFYQAAGTATVFGTAFD